MSNNEVSVALDGMWNVDGHVPIGTVRKFDDGWGFAQSHGLSGGRDRRKLTTFLGARVSDVPSVTYVIDGEDCVDEFLNCGIDESIIEAAVRSVAARQGIHMLTPGLPAEVVCGYRSSDRPAPRRTTSNPEQATCSACLRTMIPEDQPEPPREKKTMPTVRVKNHSPHRFTGYKRTTVNAPPYLASSDRTTRNPGGALPITGAWVTGRQIGVDLVSCDVFVDLGPGEECTVEIDTTQAIVAKPAPVSVEQIAMLGLPLEWDDHAMVLDPSSVVSDGAAWLAHFTSASQHWNPCDVWLRWYPGLHWIEGVVLSSRVGMRTLKLGEWEITVDTGAGVKPQRCGTPFAIMLPGCDLSSFAALSSLHVCAVGIDTLYPFGNPRYPQDFNAVEWMRRKIGPSLAAVSTLDIGAVGIAPYSGQGGLQDDQLFVAGEAMQPNGVGCELITYLGALKWANRPCHHTEQDGSPLDPTKVTARPRIFWDGQPHAGLWNLVDRLGYEHPFTLNSPDMGGWYGPDVEHWLMNTLYAGARYTGCPALQRLLEAQATVYLLQWTTVDGWSTSQAYASRAVGYECWNAVLLFHALENRTLADRVKNHWVKRYHDVLRAACERQFWSDGFEFLPTPAWAPWQQAWGAYGLWAAGTYFGEAGAVSQGTAAAINVVEHGCYSDQGHWRTYKSRPRNPATGTDDTDNSLFMFMLPCAAWLAARAGNERGQAIWQQMVDSAVTPAHRAWLPPEPQA